MQTLVLCNEIPFMRLAGELAFFVLVVTFAGVTAEIKLVYFLRFCPAPNVTKQG
jgi:hypothetical protein